MSTYKTEGIIIKRSNFGESSLLLDIYTKDYGKVEAVARSARKAKGKLKGHLELFLNVDLILAHGRNIDTITSSLAIESFSYLRNNLEFSFGAYYISELADKIMLEGHKDEQIFCLLKEVFLFLNELANIKIKYHHASVVKNKKRYCLAILMFQMHILDLAGFSPELSKCVFCSKCITPQKNYFSFNFGGVEEEECASRDPLSVPISNDSIKLLRLFQMKRNDYKNYKMFVSRCFDVLKKLNVDEKLVSNCVFLMNKFIEFNTDRKIRAIGLLDFYSHKTISK